ncbi:hypothetical protein GCM10017566_30320 [Amycolatopsis bartoniae]|uniref:Uncharacterized protein n=1 Tax=Amycolatopsis bartoniae TaxID=941986 RepID=A0A8H9IZI8_9PSEU|nr:hypothetical protein GCM10017566_30320 [Amycolatopsis bartoniae]
MIPCRNNRCLSTTKTLISLPESFMDAAPHENSGTCLRLGAAGNPGSGGIGGRAGGATTLWTDKRSPWKKGRQPAKGVPPLGRTADADGERRLVRTDSASPAFRRRPKG